MSRTRRSSHPEVIMDRLEKKHAALDEQVHRLSQQTYLSPGDQMAALQLKKEKLAAKDALLALQPD